MSKYALTKDMLDGFTKTFTSDKTARIVQNAVTNMPISQVALNREIATSIDLSMSVKVDTWPSTNQKRSGRCWIFAGLNSLKPAVYKSTNLKNFEFSQNYVHFYDKLEKANYFLTSMIELADRPSDDRTIAWLLKDPIGDGGQWTMFVALIQKYGLVPKYAMPETESSSNTLEMNNTLERLLRRGARDLRAAFANGEDTLAMKNEIMAEIHRVLSIHLGTPPTEFVWQWEDKDGNFHREGVKTPLEFAKQYAPDIEEYVCLVNDPRPTSPFGKVFTVDRLGNVVGAPAVTYLNVEISEIRKAVIETLQDGLPVWMGCDVNKQIDRKAGIWDGELFDYEGTYNVNLAMTKAEELEYGESQMTHAMQFTGVDLIDGKPRRWRIENSWSDEVGDKGFFTMNDSWFDEHVFEVAVHKKYVAPAL
ncbi:MAG: C1 family peptidase, partial [Actinomycetaceae bacterium]|nr:C1 family peptidase [Actinomycetaceae bacterium]